MRLSRLKRLPSRVKRAARFEIHAYWRRQPIVQGSVLYESFSGNGMLCNPEAIFRKLLASPDLAHLTHTWVLSDFDQYRSTIAEFAGRPNVSFVRYGSPAYFRALATSNFVVNNATFPPDFSKREGQVYLNTWHGTPLKRMGYDIEEGALATANIIRNFVAADYLLAANPFMADQMYETAYKLRGIYRGTIIEEGYPRIDRQRLDEAGLASIRATLTETGIPLGDRKIILYAPTWKGTSFSRPNDDIDDLLTHISAVESRIDTSRYIVLLKTHQIVHSLAHTRPELKRMLVPNELPTNVILGATDVLITDYSSIFFDFLETGRPVAFFAPDLADYSDTRGLYLEPDQWPGPVAVTAHELGDTLNAIAADGDAIPATHLERYLQMQQEFCGFDDGQAADRVVDIVFRGNTDGYRLRTDHSDGRKSILLYLGGMRPNGITTSVLNLLNNIDHAEYDVSAFFAQSTSPAAIGKQKAINPEVRQFPRVGGMNGTKLRHLARHLHFRRGRIAEHRDNPMQDELWNDEWTRCFGAVRVRLRRRFQRLRPVLGGPAPALPRSRAFDLAAQRPRVGCAPRGRRPEADAAQPHPDLHPLRAVRPPRLGVADPVGHQPQGTRGVRRRPQVHLGAEHGRRRPHPRICRQPTSARRASTRRRAPFPTGRKRCWPPTTT